MAQDIAADMRGEAEEEVGTAAAGGCGVEEEPWWAGDLVTVTVVGRTVSRCAQPGVPRAVDGLQGETIARLVRRAGPGAWTIAVESADGEIMLDVPGAALTIAERRAFTEGDRLAARNLDTGR
eukprot:1703415-Prymnesium_polylepis.1